MVSKLSRKQSQVKLLRVRIPCSPQRNYYFFINYASVTELARWRSAKPLKGIKPYVGSSPIRSSNNIIYAI